MKYTAQVRPIDDVFAIAVEAGERSIHTQALRASEIEEMATEALALSLEVSEEDVEIVVEWPEPIATLNSNVRSARAAYDDAMEQLRSSRAEVIDRLTADGWKQQDIATIAGLTKGRISQLKKERTNKQQTGQIHRAPEDTNRNRPGG